jgi:hypothetical protein
MTGRFKGGRVENLGPNLPPSCALSTGRKTLACAPIDGAEVTITLAEDNECLWVDLTIGELELFAQGLMKIVRYFHSSPEAGSEIE